MPPELSRILHTETAKHDVGVFETLAAAVRDREAVILTYQSDGAESPRERTVEPLQLLAERGAWYLSAWCREAGDFRTFRIDRIRGLRATGERFDPAAHGTSRLDSGAFPTDGLPVARLRFASEEAYVERDWPGSRLAERFEDGDVVAEVPFSGTDWIARHVVARLGAVEVLEPESVRAAVAALAAELAGR